MKYRIPTSFAAVLRRLGINDPAIAFDLNDVVVPVSLVDPDPFIANALPPAFGTPASAGEVAIGALGRLADTGQLAAGNWFLQCFFYNSNAGDTFRLARRNAADAGDVWSQRVTTPANGTGFQHFTIRCSCLLNERFVILDVAGSGSAQQCSIFAALT